MKNILIIGPSGHAKVVIDIVEKQGLYNIAGLVDEKARPGESVLGYEIVGRDEDLPQLVEEKDIEGFVIAVGDNALRENIYEKVDALCAGIEYPSIVHPAAQVGKDVVLGRGCVIMAGGVVNVSSKIGEFCIVNTKASLDHDCEMHDFASLAPGATIGGGCTIGRYSAIGIGAVLKHGVCIGSDCVIGAGAVVVQNVEDLALVYGIPAKTQKKRKHGDKYL